MRFLIKHSHYIARTFALFEKFAGKKIGKGKHPKNKASYTKFRKDKRAYRVGGKNFAYAKGVCFYMSLFFESKIIVTGPSFTRERAIYAPNLPASTGRPRASDNALRKSL